MRRVQVYGGILLVAALCALGYWLYKHSNETGNARAELALQEPEIKQSRERLEGFYKAWQAYRAAHKGQDPSGIDALVPKYITNPDMLVSPTAARWRKAKFDLAPGQFKIGDSTYPMSYGFMFLTAGYPRLVKKMGDKAPLIVDDSTAEALYHAVYLHRAPAGAFDPPLRDTWIPEVRDAKELVLRRDGTVEEISPSRGD